MVAGCRRPVPGRAAAAAGSLGARRSGLQMVEGVDISPVPDYGRLLRLDGRRFVVVGGGRGMGRQSVHAVTSRGASAYVIDIDPGRAAAVAEETGSMAGVGDATRRTDMERLFEDALGRLGGIDGVIDVVGLAEWGSILEMDDETWDGQLDITLRHAFLAVQLGARAMVEGPGGTIVVVASVSGQFSSANHAAYGAGKAGLLSLVKSAAEELGPDGIRVNAVVPGSVATPRVVALREAGLIRPWQDDPSPVGPPAQTSDIASAILFFSSAMSANVTGQTLVVDGGRSVCTPFPAAKVHPRHSPSELGRQRG